VYSLDAVWKLGTMLLKRHPIINATDAVEVQ
jgi:hypothetical protein